MFQNTVTSLHANVGCYANLSQEHLRYACCFEFCEHTSENQDFMALVRHMCIHISPS